MSGEYSHCTYHVYKLKATLEATGEIERLPLPDGDYMCVEETHTVRTYYDKGIFHFDDATFEHYVEQAQHYSSVYEGKNAIVVNNKYYLIKSTFRQFNKFQDYLLENRLTWDIYFSEGWEGVNFFK